MLNPQNCAKNSSVRRDGSDRCKAEAGHIAQRGCAAGCGGAGAAAAPRRAAPLLAGAPRPLPIGYGARARPTRRHLVGAVGERIKAAPLLSPHHSEFRTRRVRVHVCRVPNTILYHDFDSTCDVWTVVSVAL